jgi:hypothetical protein
MVYMEPMADDEMAGREAQRETLGFAMNFAAHPVAVPLVPESLTPLFERLRSLYDLVEPPDGNPKCKDCEAVASILDILVMG